MLKKSDIDIDLAKSFKTYNKSKSQNENLVL